MILIVFLCHTRDSSVVVTSSDDGTVKRFSIVQPGRWRHQLLSHQLHDEYSVTIAVSDSIKKFKTHSYSASPVQNTLHLPMNGEYGENSHKRTAVFFSLLPNWFLWKIDSWLDFISIYLFIWNLNIAILSSRVATKLQFVFFNEVNFSRLILATVWHENNSGDIQDLELNR